MPIRLFFTEEGNLGLNASEQDNFSIEDEGFFLVLPLKTVDRGDNHIVIDPSDNLNGVIEYLLTELKRKKYPVELDESLRIYWGIYSYEKEKISELKKLRHPRIKKKSSIQNIFRKNRKPLDHQVRGILHALSVDNDANFSVPGSGKTQVALGIFHIWKKNKQVDKALVIGPASSFMPWETEINECLRQPFKVTRWSGSISQRKRLGSKVKESDLVLITYQTACNDFSLLERLLRTYKFLLILDESHHIKNPDSLRAGVSLRLAPYASKRLILTGTPSPHSISDIWTQFSFLWPSRQLLGNFYDFKQEIDGSVGAVKNLSNQLRPFFIRTTKKELGLPVIKNEHISIKEKNIPNEQKNIIKLLELQTLAEARKLSLTDFDMNVLRNWRKARIIRFLQAVSNPALLTSRLDAYNIDDQVDIDNSKLMRYVSVFLERKRIPAKIEAVVDRTKVLVNSGHKVVVWSWFVENIKYLSELLRDFNPLMIYGEIKPYVEKEDPEIEESREKNIYEFKNKRNRPVLLANPAACAESISLHKQCQNAIYLDRNFNCGQFLQSMDRIHRVGMPPGLTATYFIPFINCAIERAVDRRLKKRQGILYTLLNDPMPVLGIDDEAWISDSEEELDKDFSALLNEIQNGTANEYKRSY